MPTSGKMRQEARRALRHARGTPKEVIVEKDYISLMVARGDIKHSFNMGLTGIIIYQNVVYLVNNIGKEKVGIRRLDTDSYGGLLKVAKNFNDIVLKINSIIEEKPRWY